LIKRTVLHKTANDTTRYFKTRLQWREVAKGRYRVSIIDSGRRGGWWEDCRLVAHRMRWRRARRILRFCYSFRAREEKFAFKIKGDGVSARENYLYALSELFKVVSPLSGVGIGARARFADLITPPTYHRRQRREENPFFLFSSTRERKRETELQ